MVLRPQRSPKRAPPPPLQQQPMRLTRPSTGRCILPWTSRYSCHYSCSATRGAQNSCIDWTGLPLHLIGTHFGKIALSKFFLAQCVLNSIGCNLLPRPLLVGEYSRKNKKNQREREVVSGISELLSFINSFHRELFLSVLIFFFLPCFFLPVSQLPNFLFHSRLNWFSCCLVENNF